MYSQNCRLRDIKKELRLSQTIFECSIRQLERISSQEDPVMRYRLPVELFRISNDLMLTLTKIFFEEYTENRIEDIIDAHKSEGTSELPGKMEGDILDLRTQLGKVVDTVSRFQTLIEEFGEQFSHWISIPHYDPGQLLGKQILDEANAEFDSLME